ncbi:MAG: carboxypeptidase-like regulatory domain-containing protein, partial [Edaphobacter sp.]
MYTSMRRVIFAAIAICFSVLTPGLWAQAAGNSGTINGTVTDATGAIVPGAKVSIENPVSGYSRTAISDSAGHYQLTNVPLNP